MKITINILALVFLSIKGIGQYPGNISTNIALWFKANDGTSTTTDGATVSAWNDQSGNAKHMNGVSSPSYEENEINFNPAIHYQNPDKHFINSPSLDAQGTTFYIVGKPEGTEAQTWLTNDTAFATANDILLYLQSSGTVSYYNESGINTYASTLTWSSGTIAIARTELTDVTNYNAIYSLNGGATATVTNANSAAQANNLYTSIGNWNETDFEEPFGYIAETVVYDNVTQSATDKQKIESYLAIKYGVTLDDAAGGTAGDYLASDGGTIWDASVQATYHYDVTGIGRDDNSELDQRVSKSSNSDVIVTIALDNDFTSANNDAGRITSWSVNDSWLLWGNDNGTASFGTSYGGTTRFTRVWKAVETGTVPNVYVQFTDNDISNSTTYYLIGGNNPPTDWQSITSATSEASGNTVRFGTSNMTQYEFFTIAQGSPLPVELIEWEVEKEKNSVLLKWKTASEVENDYYTVEKSKNSIDWKIIKRVKGLNYSNQITSYKEIDEEPYAGISYYRLSQTDLDGSRTFFSIKSVQFNESVFLEVFPNPTSDRFQIKIKVYENALGTLSLNDNTGKTISIEEIELVEGENIIQVPVSKYNAGTYTVSVQLLGYEKMEQKLIIE